MILQGDAIRQTSQSCSCVTKIILIFVLVISESFTSLLDNAKGNYSYLNFLKPLKRRQ